MLIGNQFECLFLGHLGNAGLVLSAKCVGQKIARCGATDTANRRTLCYSLLWLT